MAGKTPPCPVCWREDLVVSEIVLQSTCGERLNHSIKVLSTNTKETPASTFAMIPKFPNRSYDRVATNPALMVVRTIYTSMASRVSRFRDPVRLRVEVRK